MSYDETTPFEYFKICITEKYLDFDGRARRAEYWFFGLFMFLTLILFGAILENEILALIVVGSIGLIGLALFLPSLAVTVRRLHDTNKSGWFYLIAFIPVGGIILFVFTVLEGDRRNNMYGKDPKSHNEPDVSDHLEIR